MSELWNSSCCGDISNVKLCLEEGIDVNWADERGGMTSLCIAIWSGHYSVVKYLLDNFAEVNIKTKGGNTPLKIACELNLKEIALLLMIYDANLSFSDKSSRNAESYAKGHGWDFDKMKIQASIIKSPIHLDILFMCILEKEKAKRVEDDQGDSEEEEQEYQELFGRKNTFLQDCVKKVHNSDIFFTMDVFPYIYGIPNC